MTQELSEKFSKYFERSNLWRIILIYMVSANSVHNCFWQRLNEGKQLSLKTFHIYYLQSIVLGHSIDWLRSQSIWTLNQPMDHYLLCDNLQHINRGLSIHIFTSRNTSSLSLKKTFFYFLSINEIPFGNFSLTNFPLSDFVKYLSLILQNPFR